MKDTTVDNKAIRWTMTNSTDSSEFSKVRWLPTLSIFAVPVAVAAIWGSMQRPQYQASAKMLFETEEVSELTGLDERIGDIKGIVGQQNPLLTELEVLQSRPILNATIAELDLRDEEGQLLQSGAIRQGLTVKILGATDIVQISFISEDPEAAAQVPNTLAKFYIVDYLERKNAQPREARNILENQLAVARQRMENSEDALREFREKHNFINASTYSTFVVDAIARLDSEILSTQARLDELAVRIDSRVSSLGVNTQEAQLIRTLNQDPAVSALLANLTAAENDLALQQTVHNPSSPVIASLQENIRSLRAQLDGLTSSYGPGISTNKLLLQADTLQQSSIADLNGEEIERNGLTSRLGAPTVISKCLCK